jgi:hypothetical protein
MSEVAGVHVLPAAGPLDEIRTRLPALLPPLWKRRGRRAPRRPPGSPPRKVGTGDHS